MQTLCTKKIGPFIIPTLSCEITFAISSRYTAVHAHYYHGIERYLQLPFHNELMVDRTVFAILYITPFTLAHLFQANFSPVTHNSSAQN